jgi:hypothetical protein
MNKNTQNENKKTARRTCREALSTVGGITPYNQRPGAGAAENKRLPQLGRRGGKARAGEKTARRLAEMTNSSTIQPIVVARDEVVLRYDDDVNIPRLTEAVGKFCIKPAFCGCLDSKHCVLEDGSALGEGVRCRKLHSGKPVVLKGRYLGELGTFGIQKDALSEAATKAEDFLKRNKSTCR